MSAWLKLETFNDPNLEEMVEATAQWFDAIRNGDSPRWMSYLGNSGTGKTHCARRLWRWIENRPAEFNRARNEYSRPFHPLHLRCLPFFVTWPAFVANRLRRQEFEEFEDMQRWPFLALDDIGAERDSTGFASECLYTLLAERWNKWTIITSNLGMKDLAAIDKRIADRLVRDDNRVIELNTQSYALRNPRNQAN